MTKTTRPTTAFIWRQSIYDNEFKCKCGYKLYKPYKHSPASDVKVDITNGVLYCPKCGWLVGKMVDMGETDLEPGLHGLWPEFEKKNAN